MSKPQPINWTGERAEKWRTHLTGTEAMLKPVDEPLIRALNLDGPYRIADVACGGGGTTFEIRRRAPRGSVVHGFDISRALIEIAREREPSTSDIAFECADMQSASAPDKLYDRLVSRFGTMFFADPPAAFANILTWLAPGGRFAFAVWNRPDENPWLACVRGVVAEVADVPAPRPDEPGPFRYKDVNVLLGLLDRAGYAELDAYDWRGSVAIGGGMSAANAARFALASFSTFAELLAEAGSDASREAHQRLETRFHEYEESGEVRLAARVHIVTGVRRAGK